jgi:hypothetical protein
MKLLLLLTLVGLAFGFAGPALAFQGDNSGEGAAVKRREFCRSLGKNRITVEFGPLENSVIAVGLQILESLPGFDSE